jgi:dienelactone hydrolase
MRLLIIAALAFALFAAACGGDDNDSATNQDGQDSSPSPGISSDQPVFGTVVQYPEESGETVTAEYLAPENAPPAAGVLLLHQADGTRQQWAEFAPLLAARGFAVLAPDLDYSGFDGCAPPNETESDPACRDRTDALLNDVQDALDYLKQRPEADPERLAVIGADFGANLAFVSAGLQDDVDTAIVISPDSRPADPALVGRSYPEFAPSSVLFISDEQESGDAAVLANATAEPVNVKIAVGQAAHGGRAAHGVELLANEAFVEDMFEWLATHLPA